ncbi:MAG: hypothetical protein PHI31_06795 [Desulfuromonadaceae bacterium]|nr:hypothetical protein [Desulfuromonadaceae bacterium]
MKPNPKNWEFLEKEVESRRKLLLEALRARFPNSNTVAMAATDVFVEKAQLALSQRAEGMVFWGLVTGGLGTIVLILTAVYLGYVDFFHPDHSKYDNYTFTLKLVKTTTISALILGADVMLMGLAKSLLHEAMVLYNRRHALRFGRLYVYTQNGNVNIDKLIDAFEWNSEYTSAFKDLKPETISKTILHKIFELPPDTLRAAGDFLRANKERKNKSEND